VGSTVQQKRMTGVSATDTLVEHSSGSTLSAVEEAGDVPDTLKQRQIPKDALFERAEVLLGHLPENERKSLASIVKVFPFFSDEGPRHSSWKLENDQVFNYFSNLVGYFNSSEYSGDCVIRLCLPWKQRPKWFRLEIQNGSVPNGFVHYDYDGRRYLKPSGLISELHSISEALKSFD
jgi:hypothetical protein